MKLPESRFELNESQRQTVVHALFIAIERYKENVKTCHECGHPALAKQFACQAAETQAISDRIENAQMIVIGQVVPEECADCGSTGHDTGSNTCPGPDVQDRLEDPNKQAGAL
jgi:hypothetical protein